MGAEVERRRPSSARRSRSPDADDAPAALLAIDDATLCALLLCLGGGSVFAMQLAGVLGTRLGSKPVITVGGIGLAALLPTLAMAQTTLQLAMALLCFEQWASRPPSGCSQASCVRYRPLSNLIAAAHRVRKANS